MPLAPPTQAVANVQAAEQRRRVLAQKLAQQMAARQATRGVSSTGRIQASGRSFGNAVDLRAGGTPKLTLPFLLPNGRMRPAGYDESESAPVIPAAPVMGGGLGVGNALPDPAQVSGAAALPTPVNSGVGSNAYRPGLQDPGGYNSDTPLEQAPPPGASVLPPDPYTVMMQRMNTLRANRLYGATGDAGYAYYPGAQM